MKKTPRDQIQGVLKGGSSIPELAEFKDQARDVFAMGGFYGLDCWIDARLRLGLIVEKTVVRAARNLSNTSIKAIYQGAKSRAKVSPLTVEEKYRLIVERENKRRNPKPHHLHQTLNSKESDTSSRMKAAWDQLRSGLRPAADQALKEIRSEARSGQPRIDSSEVQGRSSG